MICVQNQKNLYTKVYFRIHKKFLLNLFIISNKQNIIFSFEKYYITKSLESLNNEIFIFKKYKE